MTWYELLTLAVAATAAGVAWYQSALARRHAKEAGASASEANQIAGRLAAIEEERRLEELERQRDAEIVATTQFNKELRIHVIEVVNEGPGWARRVSITGNGSERATKDYEADGRDLGSGDSRGYKIGGDEWFGMSNIVNWYVEWTTDNGDSRKVRIRAK